MDAESMYYEIQRLKRVVGAYEKFEGEVEYASGKVPNDRISEALEELKRDLEEIGE